MVLFNCMCFPQARMPAVDFNYNSDTYVQRNSFEKILQFFFKNDTNDYQQFKKLNQIKT